MLRVTSISSIFRFLPRGRCPNMHRAMIINSQQRSGCCLLWQNYLHSLECTRWGPNLTTIKSIHTTSTQRNKEKEPQQNGNYNNKTSFLLGVAVSLIGSTVIYMLLTDASTDPSNSLSFKEFVEELLPTGEVIQLRMNSYSGGHKAHALLRPGAAFHGKPTAMPMVVEITGIKNADEFERIVRSAEKALGINPTAAIPISHQPVNTGDFLVAVVFLVGAIALTVYAISRMQSVYKNAGGMFSQSSMISSSLNKTVATGIKFTDVAGCSEAKQEVMEFVHYLKHPEKYQKLGAKMPRGCLLTGPPGVGKTLLAKAVASEAEVPFISKAGSDFVEMIGGLGARRVRELFKEARSVAPCIVYIDELDAVGAKRSSSNPSMPGGSSERDQTLNQILVEMDGILSSAHDVVVMGSTNRVDMLDKALLRPGRFDRHIAIDLPTKIERKAIFEIHLIKLKLKQAFSVYSGRLADLSPGMSGADIANICNEAAICAAREKHEFIDVEHFEQAFERVLGGSRKKSSALSPEERKIVAVHEAGHALVGWMLKHSDTLIKVSIVPRTKSALGFTRTLPRENSLYTSEILMHTMAVKLAGRAAENLVFGTVTHGAEDDLKNVTEIAYSKVKEFGLDDTVGNVSFSNTGDEAITPYSDALQHEIDSQVKDTVYEAHKLAHDILVENRDKLDILTKELLANEVLNYEDIVQLIGPSPYGDQKPQDALNFNA